VFPLNLYAHVRFSIYPLHMRPRVQRAPGLPCALYLLGRNELQTSGAACRENAESHPAVVPANAGTHTPCPLVSAVEWIPSDTIDARGYGSRRKAGTTQRAPPKQKRRPKLGGV